MLARDSVHTWTAHALAVVGAACVTALFFEVPHVALVAAVCVVGGCVALRSDATKTLAQWHSAAIHLSVVWFFWMVYCGVAVSERERESDEAAIARRYAAVAADALQTLWGVYCATRLRTHITQKDRAAALGVVVAAALWLSSPLRASHAPLATREMRLATYAALQSTVALALVRGGPAGHLTSFGDHLYLFVATGWVPCVHWIFGVGGAAWLLARTFVPIVSKQNEALAKPKVEERVVSVSVSVATSAPMPAPSPSPSPSPTPTFVPPKNKNQNKPSIGFVLEDKTVVFPNKKKVAVAPPARRRPTQRGDDDVTETLFGREVEKLLSGAASSAALPPRKRMSDLSVASTAPLRVPPVRDEATLRADEAAEAAAAAAARSSLPRREDSSDDDDDEDAASKKTGSLPPPLQLEETDAAASSRSL